ITLAAALPDERIDTLAIEVGIRAEARRILGDEGFRLRVGQGRQNGQTAGTDTKRTPLTDSERQRLDRKRPDTAVDGHGVIAAADREEHGIPRLRCQEIKHESTGIAEAVM